MCRVSSEHSLPVHMEVQGTRVETRPAEPSVDDHPRLIRLSRHTGTLGGSRGGPPTDTIIQGPPHHPLWRGGGAGVGGTRGREPRDLMVVSWRGPAGQEDGSTVPM